MQSENGKRLVTKHRRREDLSTAIGIVGRLAADQVLDVYGYGGEPGKRMGEVLTDAVYAIYRALREERFARAHTTDPDYDELRSEIEWDKSEASATIVSHEPRIY